MNGALGWIDIAIVAAIATAGMVTAWWRQRRSNNLGYVDIVWAACLAGAATYYAVFGNGASAMRITVATLVVVWAARLGLHLWQRVSTEPEDGRYAYLRRHWQGDQRKLFGFFMAQAALGVMFSLPFLAVAENPQASVAQLSLGIAIWCISLGGESLADHQLARWRADPSKRGQTCRAGLWRYSRHPNYFFEWLHWFAYVALAIGSPLWWLSLFGPVAMLATLLWITGIPFVEAQALRSRGDDYRRYQRETSVFVPWFPKHAPT